MALHSASTDDDARPPERPEAEAGSTARAAVRGAAGPDLGEVALAVRRHWPWVLLSVLAALALACAAVAMLPARYTATAELLIDPQGLQVVKDDLNPPGQASDASLLLVDSQVQVLSSDDVLRRVVEKFDLADDPEFIARPGVVGRLSALLGSVLGRHPPAPDPQLAALRSLRERLAVRRIERSFALSVAVSSESADKAARLAQGLAQTYLDYDRQIRADLAGKAGAAIGARLGELQADVRDAENAAQAYRTAHNLVGTRTQLLSEQQLGQIADQLGAARARADEQRARLDQIEAVVRAHGSLDSLPEVLQSPTITQLRTQLAQAERTLADQATRLGARHPAMIAAQSSVATAKAQLDAEVRRIATSVRNGYRTAVANADALADTLEKNKSQAVAVGDAQVHLRELERQIDARRSVYEAFLVRARELQAQQQLATSASRIISPATPPGRRDGPPAIALLGVALAGGLGIGILCALLAERTGGRVRTPRRLARRLGLEVIGTVPQAPDFGGSGAALERYDLGVVRVLSHLRHLEGATGSRAVVVTAADKMSDKSALALRLATLAAANGDRVLLVDADPDGNLPGSFDLPILPGATRPGAARTGLVEHAVSQLPGLRYVGVSRRAARLDARALIAAIGLRAREMDAVIINAGILGADLLTERLVADESLGLVLVAVSARRSDLGGIARVMATVETGPALAAVLTDTPPSVA